MRVLITGTTGMAGSHLAELAVQQPGVQVYGIYRWRSRMDNLEDLARQGKLNVIEGEISSAEDLEARSRNDALNLAVADLLDSWSIQRLVAAVQPDWVFHLAAQSFVPASWNAPAQTLHNNIIGQVHLLEALRQTNVQARVQIAGSSEEYGLVYPDEVPIKESNPLRPLSPYAVSKVAQEMLGWQYWRSYGLQIIVTRAFNHTGPRRGSVFVTSSLAKQVAEIEAGLRPPLIEVGDVTSSRDWTDVRDVVRAYWLALDKAVPGEAYNIGSGKAHTVQELLDLLLSLSTLRNIEVRQDPARLRPSDVRMLLPDTSKFRSQTNWAPKVPFDQTIRDLLDYWRERVGQPANTQAVPADPKK